MARLVFSGEKYGGRIYEFALERTTVGRGSQNTLTIHDPSVSNNHCEVFVYNEDVIVRDLGSSNGTFVNGERLHNQQRPLKAGQTVKFGAVAARLELAERPLADTTTEMTAFHASDRGQGKATTSPPERSPFTLSPDSHSPDYPDAQTLMLPRPAESSQSNQAPALKQPVKPGKPARNVLIFLILAVSVAAITCLVWLVWRGR